MYKVPAFLLLPLTRSHWLGVSQGAQILKNDYISRFETTLSVTFRVFLRPGPAPRAQSSKLQFDGKSVTDDGRTDERTYGRTNIKNLERPYTKSPFGAMIVQHCICV